MYIIKAFKIHRRIMVPDSITPGFLVTQNVVQIVKNCNHNVSPNSQEMLNKEIQCLVTSIEAY